MGTTGLIHNNAWYFISLSFVFLLFFNEILIYKVTSIAVKKCCEVKSAIFPSKVVEWKYKNNMEKLKESTGTSKFCLSTVLEKMHLSEF